MNTKVRIILLCLFLCMNSLSYSQILFGSRLDETTGILTGISTTFKNVDVVYWDYNADWHSKFVRIVTYKNAQVYADFIEPLSSNDYGFFGKLHVQPGLWKVELFDDKGVMVAESQLITIID